MGFETSLPGETPKSFYSLSHMHPIVDILGKVSLKWNSFQNCLKTMIIQAKWKKAMWCATTSRRWPRTRPTGRLSSWRSQEVNLEPLAHPQTLKVYPPPPYPAPVVWTGEMSYKHMRTLLTLYGVEPQGFFFNLCYRKNFSKRPPAVHWITAPEDRAMRGSYCSSGPPLKKNFSKPFLMGHWLSRKS